MVLYWVYENGCSRAGFCRFFFAFLVIFEDQHGLKQILLGLLLVANPWFKPRGFRTY